MRTTGRGSWRWTSPAALHWEGTGSAVWPHSGVHKAALGTRSGTQTHLKISVSTAKWNQLPEVRWLHHGVKWK